MCFKKMKKLEDYSLKGKTEILIFLTIAILLGMVYVGLLIKPDWQILIDLPYLHQGIAYFIISLMFLGIGFVIYIIIDTVIDKNALEKSNEQLAKDNARLNYKIEEFEKELRRLQNK